MRKSARPRVRIASIAELAAFGFISFDGFDDLDPEQPCTCGHLYAAHVLATEGASPAEAGGLILCRDCDACGRTWDADWSGKHPPGWQPPPPPSPEQIADWRARAFS